MTAIASFATSKNNFSISLFSVIVNKAFSSTKIQNFDESEFLMETNMGYLKISGNNLEIVKLDTYQGDVSIKGKINSFNYLEGSKKQEKQESIISKLFKW